MARKIKTMTRAEILDDPKLITLAAQAAVREAVASMKRPKADKSRASRKNSKGTTKRGR